MQSVRHQFAHPRFEFWYPSFHRSRQGLPCLEQLPRNGLQKRRGEGAVQITRNRQQYLGREFAGERGRAGERLQFPAPELSRGAFPRAVKENNALGTDERLCAPCVRRKSAAQGLAS
jgi:hypothetical protein